MEALGFYGVDPKKVKPEEQQALTAYFQQAVTEQVGKKFAVVTDAGARVRRIQIAVLDADAATPGARSLAVVPPAQSGGRVASLATGKFPFPGGPLTVGKATDSVTGQILGAAVGERGGGAAFKPAAVCEWGDARNAIDEWAQLLTDGLYAHTSGAKKP